MVFVTGATGFLGSYVCLYLIEKGYKIKASKRENSTIPSFLQKHTNEIEWLNVDLLDFFEMKEALQDCDAIFHCAAMVSFLQKHRETMMKINVEGTANVVNIALQCGVETLCHVSSIAALGRAKGDSRIDETSKWSESKAE